MIFNVRVTVVEVVEADSAEAAYTVVCGLLYAARLEPFDGARADDIAATFESEEGA